MVDGLRTPLIFVLVQVRPRVELPEQIAAAVGRVLPVKEAGVGWLSG